MANEMLFIGGRLDSVTVVAGSPTENSGTSYRDTANTDCYLRIAGPGDIVDCPLTHKVGGVAVPDSVVTGETYYGHFVFGQVGTATTSGKNMFELIDDDGYPWFAIRTKDTIGGHGYYYNSGTGASPTWTQLGVDDAWPVSGANRQTYDIKVTLGSPHTLEVSIDGSLVLSTTFTAAGFTSIAKGRFNFHQGGTQAYAISEIMMSRGISTVGGFVQYARPTGAGTNTDWTGAYTDVNEAVNSDATTNSATTNGLVQTYPVTDVTIPEGFAIAEVRHHMRAKNNGGTPANIKSVVRSGGVDYLSNNIPEIGTSFVPLEMIYADNPDSGSPWTEANFNSAEFGFKSIT